MTVEFVSTSEGGVEAVAGGPPRAAAASGSLAGSILRLAAGRGAVVGIGLVSAPILTRLYDPDSFGTLSLLLAIVAVIEGFTSLCYVKAMPLAESNAHRRALFLLSAILGALGTVVVGVASFWTRDALAYVFRAPELASYVVAIPVLYLATAMNLLIETTLSCERKFGLVSMRNVVMSGGTRGTQIIAGFAGMARSPLGLVVGNIAGTFAGALSFSAPALAALFGHGQGRTRLADLAAVAAQHRKFPLFQLWSKTLDASTVHLPVFLMGLLFPVHVVGLYSWARNLVFLPMQMFTVASGDVYYVEAAQAAARGHSPARATLELLRMLVALTSFPLTVIFVLGPLVFEVLFGAPWREAGVYSQMLVPWIAVIAVASPFFAMFATTNRQGEGLVYSVVLLLTLLGGMAVGGLWLGPRGALAAFSACSTVVWAHALARTLKLAQVSRRSAARLLASSYAEAALLVTPAGVLYWVLHWRIGALTAAVLAGAIYGYMLYRRHPRIRATLNEILLRARPSALRDSRP